MAIGFLMSQIRPAFHSQIELRQATGLTVLGEVARIWTIHEKRKHKKNLYLLGLSLSSLLFLYILLLIKILMKITIF